MYILDNTCLCSTYMCAQESIKLKTISGRTKKWLKEICILYVHEVGNADIRGNYTY